MIYFELLVLNNDVIYKMFEKTLDLYGNYSNICNKKILNKLCWKLFL